MLSHGLWTRRYRADPALVGSTIQIDGAAFTVVGVMPPDFVFQFFSGPRQLWVPAGWTTGDQSSRRQLVRVDCAAEARRQRG